MRRNIIRSFQRDDSGAVAAIFGLLLIVILVAAGIAIDSLRSSNASSRIQAALDAAALVGAKKLGAESASDADVLAAARLLFEADVKSLKIGGVAIGNFQVAIDRTTSSVTATADVTIKTLLAHVGGAAGSLTRQLSSTSAFKAKKIELSLVLDVTGSMASSGKIDALKTAANDLVDAMFAANPLPEAVRVALVPYSASVNAGAYYYPVTSGGSAGNLSSWSSWSGWTAGATDTCVVERAGADAYTATPPGMGTYLGTSSAAANSRYSCPVPTVVPLSDLSDSAVRTAFKASINALQPGGGTAGHIGAAWGWYMLQPSWNGVWPAASQARAFSDDVTKVVILMTDGEFNTSYENGNVNSTDFSAQGSSGYQALQICDGMTADNIVIYTIGLMAPANAEAMLKQCSGPQNFYDANTSSQLLQAFRDIVDKLNNLHLTQ